MATATFAKNIKLPRSSNVGDARKIMPPTLTALGRLRRCATFGTGKLKGTKGKGTYKCQPSGDNVDCDVEGEYTLRTNNGGRAAVRGPMIEPEARLAGLAALPTAAAGQGRRGTGVDGSSPSPMSQNLGLAD